MKLILLFLFTIIYSSLFSQSSKTNFTLDYALLNDGNFENYEDNSKIIWAHQAFLKAQFPLKGRWSFATGLGFINLQFVRFTSYVNIRDTEIHAFNNYLVIPAGFGYKLDFIDILPEVGLGYNLSNPSFYYLYHDPDNPPEKHDLTSLEFLPDPPNFIVPFFLTIRTEIEITQFSLLFGIKGFILTSDFHNALWKGNEFGYGLLIGAKF